MLALQRQLTYRRTFASMKSIIITILIVFALIPMIAKAQFNTVSGHAPRVRFTAINEKEASPESDTSQVRMPQESELPNTIVYSMLDGTIEKVGYDARSVLSKSRHPSVTVPTHSPASARCTTASTSHQHFARVGRAFRLSLHIQKQNA